VWVHHGGGGGYIWCGYTMMAVVGIYGVGRHVNDRDGLQENNKSHRNVIKLVKMLPGHSKSTTYPNHQTLLTSACLSYYTHR